MCDRNLPFQVTIHWSFYFYVKYYILSRLVCFVSLVILLQLKTVFDVSVIDIFGNVIVYHS